MMKAGIIKKIEENRREEGQTQSPAWLPIPESEAEKEEEVSVIATIIEIDL